MMKYVMPLSPDEDITSFGYKISKEWSKAKKITVLH